MYRWTCLIGAITAAAVFHGTLACDVLLSNDDGWAGALIRAQRDSLVNGGFNVRSPPLLLSRFYIRSGVKDIDLEQVILSGPAQDMSARGASSAPPQPLTKPCQFDTCPTGSPAEGFNTSDCKFQMFPFCVDRG